MWYQWTTWLMTCEPSFLDEMGETDYIVWKSVQPTNIDNIMWFERR